ncbi:hypothetical protein HMP0721_1921 [Pseudoramibacter alactolyticus ATCC 23263]|uniref:Uncharacterized protein n=1 Tax=Pseudoramibacter alactolyticus ATCC 23263 TaxID=887929 RepID=E6MIT6_9FIRM|nr:hypothetical protein HMP0721_1921 [Pseudoramibacter alactolyticus ATCC 23263]
MLEQAAPIERGQKTPKPDKIQTIRWQADGLDWTGEPESAWPMPKIIAFKPDGIRSYRFYGSRCQRIGKNLVFIVSV